MTRTVVNAAFEQIANADDPEAALNKARRIIDAAREKLGVDADAASLLNGFEARAAALIGGANTPAEAGGI